MEVLEILMRVYLLQLLFLTGSFYDLQTWNLLVVVTLSRFA